MLPIIMGKPTIYRSTDIERNEHSTDSSPSEEQYRALGINVGHYTIESRLGKRNSPICSETCGKVDIKSCATLIDEGVAFEKVPLC